MTTTSSNRRSGGVLMKLLAAVAACLFSTSAQAYQWRTCNGEKIVWNSGWTNMYINTVSMPPGTLWDTQLQYSMWYWNNVQGSGFNFYVGRDTDGTFNNSNGMNEIYFDSGISGALAVTYSSWTCYWFFGWHIGNDEADIGFNTNYSWSLGSYDYANPSGPPYNYQSVALHELGHALGLNHEDRWMATMNSYYPNSGPVGYWKTLDVLGDDRQGARVLYPDGTTETDIAASAHQFAGGGTSRLVDSPSSAARGSAVNIGFTFSNQGTATQSFDIGFYLSTSPYITTGSTFLGANYGAFGTPGFMGTFTRTLTIPSWIAPGTYYLGFIVDFDNLVLEQAEYNNNQPMPRTIFIF